MSHMIFTLTYSYTLIVPIPPTLVTLYTLYLYYDLSSKVQGWVHLQSALGPMNHNNTRSGDYNYYTVSS